MGLKYTTGKVLSNVEISSGMFLLNIEGDYKVKPGQFYMLSVLEGETLLPRPISIHEVNEKGIYFLYEAKGKGTKVLSKLQEDDSIQLLGPLGNGFDIDKISGRIAIVSGGMGIAPMKQLVKNLYNCEIDLYCGFRNDIYGIEGLESFVNKIYIATESGRIGHKGYVTEMLDASKYEIVLSCGPEPMMLKLLKTCKMHKVPIYVSMERYMACGLGACLVCTCSTIYGNKRTCKDGPVFLGEDLMLNA
ncbi:dihydroorotate dehydrogenase electron transfer subunit [Candidatus Clostridium stratigraminis]|uniref:Dihydroorotate dehydrogenase B (NAD(+)), electron transfer subunit n=1 Tax=Candidatus Clostridium stratigraminis TaxID=3381661 RepID=A0ABW8T1J3_9CLOT